MIKCHNGAGRFRINKKLDFFNFIKKKFKPVKVIYYPVDKCITFYGDDLEKIVSRISNYPQDFYWEWIANDYGQILAINSFPHNFCSNKDHISEGGTVIIFQNKMEELLRFYH